MGFWDWATGASPGQAVGQAAGQVVKEGLTATFDGLYKIIDQFSTNDQEKIQAKMAVAEYHLRVTQTYIADVQNARAMQIQTQSVWPGVMSFLAGAGFFGGFITVLAHGLPENLDEFTKSIIFTFVGAMVASWTTALNFWMGSTMGSQNKDALLHQSTPTNKN